MKLLATILLLAGASLAVTPAPRTERAAMWDRIEVKPERYMQVQGMVTRYEMTKARYEKVARGIPAPVIFVLHMRESTCSFAKHLHEGSPLTGRTKYVPKGRPASGNPPFSWEESARDALYIIKSYDAPAKWVAMDATVDYVERYNGTGYRSKGVPSPYLVAGSNLQKPGKYVADGRFDRNAWDKQLGCLTVLKALADRGLYSPPP